MEINKIVKDALFKYQQQDYKRGGVSIAPEMYETIANEIEVKVKNLVQMIDRITKVQISTSPAILQSKC